MDSNDGKRSILLDLDDGRSTVAGQSGYLMEDLPLAPLDFNDSFLPNDSPLCGRLLVFIFALLEILVDGVPEDA